MKTDLKKLPKSQIEVDFELDPEEFLKYINKALENFKIHTKMDGFRPGQVPLKMVEKKVGDENLLMEAGDLAVKETYAKFVNENNLEPIGRPEVEILKIAKGNPFLFKVKISVLPEIELPDYKKIASHIKGKEISVDDKEVEDALKYLQKSRAKFSQINRDAEKKDFVEIVYQNENINNGQEIKDRFILGEAGFLRDFEDNLIGMKAGQEKEFIAKLPDNGPNNLEGKESSFKVKMVAVQKMELPEINDKFAEGLGAFKTLAVLKESIKEGITVEKNEAEKQKKRGEILNKISENIRFDLPEKMVDYEQSRLIEDLKNRVSGGFKTTFDEYLKSIRKTEEEVRKSFMVEAEKNIKNFLVLRQIGKSENVEILNEEIEKKVNEIIKNYTKEEVEKIDINKLREYIKDTIYNEKIFQLLEKFSHQ